MGIYVTIQMLSLQKGYKQRQLPTLALLKEYIGIEFRSSGGLVEAMYQVMSRFTTRLNPVYFKGLLHQALKFLFISA